MCNTKVLLFPRRYRELMAKQITLRRSGGSISATLPKALVERFHLEAGDSVSVIETDTGILLTPFDPDFAEGLKAYSQGARKYMNALKELSK